jgi:hypothetical protein
MMASYQDRCALRSPLADPLRNGAKGVRLIRLLDPQDRNLVLMSMLQGFMLISGFAVDVRDFSSHGSIRRFLGQNLAQKLRRLKFSNHFNMFDWRRDT